MIAKCIAVLAIVAQINASVCSTRPVCLANAGLRSTVGGLANVAGAGAGGSVLTRNVVVKGKFPVALSNCGPTPDKQIPLTTSHVRTPVQVKPTVRLPCNVPPPKVVSHTCTCYKTVVRPRVHDQYITVPTVQRYIETTHKPVVENIHYEACPTNCDNNSGFVFTRVGGVNGVSGVSGLTGLTGVSSCGLNRLSGMNRLVEVSNQGFCGVPSVQAVQTVPTVQTLQAVQTVPTVQAVQTVPTVQAVQTVPTVQVNSGCSLCN